MRAFIEKENKERTLDVGAGKQVKEVLEELRINPVTVLVVRNNELLLEDDEIKDNDELKIISVISGG